MNKGPMDALHPEKDFESEPVLGTRLDIGDHEHRLKITSHPVTGGKPG